MSHPVPRLYAHLLRHYPPVFRDRFSVEMAFVFAQAWDQARGRGRRAALTFCLREFAGLGRSVLHARLTSSQENPMLRIAANPRFVLPLLALGCLIGAGLFSLGHWGYLLEPPSPAALTASLATVDSIHLVQFDPDYRATTLPVSRLSSTPIADYPPSRILPLLPDQAAQTVQATSLDADLTTELADALRAAQVTLGRSHPDYPSRPRYCRMGTEQCFDDIDLIRSDQRYYFRYGVQMQSDGTLLFIEPTFDLALQGDVQTAPPRPTGETYSAFGPEDAVYYRYLLPVGYVIQGRAADGTPLVLVALASGDLDNDHYAAYSGLFEVNANGLQARTEQRFWFDVSGLEGLTLPLLALFLFVPLTLVWLCLLALGWTVRRLVRLRLPREWTA